MAKFAFTYSKLDGRKGNFKITASSKIEAIKKGMDRAKKDGETVTQWDCRIVSA